jgi:hypothetical protein
MRALSFAAALATAASVYVCKPCAAGQSVARTAIGLDLTNKAGARFEYLARIATDQVAAELAKSGKYEILSRAEVQRKIKELDLKPPLDRNARSRLAGNLGAQLIVDGTIEFVRANKKKKPPVTNVGLKIWVEDAQTGDLMSGAAVIGVASVSDSPDAFTRELSNSIRIASGEAVARSMTYHPLEAVVLTTGNFPPNCVGLNSGKRNGLDEGMVLTVWREGKGIGQVQVIDTYSEDCLGKIIENPGGIRAEDKAIIQFKMPDYTAPVFARTPQKAIVLDFRNKAKSLGGYQFGEMAGDTVAGGLTKSGRFEIVPRYLMDRKCKEHDIANPPKFNYPIRLANELHATVVVTGEIEYVRDDEVSGLLLLPWVLKYTCAMCPPDVCFLKRHRTELPEKKSQTRLR